MLSKIKSKEVCLVSLGREFHSLMAITEIPLSKWGHLEKAFIR